MYPVTPPVGADQLKLAPVVVGVPAVTLVGALGIQIYMVELLNDSNPLVPVAVALTVYTVPGVSPKEDNALLPSEILEEDPPTPYSL